MRICHDHEESSIFALNYNFRFFGLNWTKKEWADMSVK